MNKYIFTNSLCEKLKRRRVEDLKLTLAQMAEKCNTSSAALSRFENSNFSHAYDEHQVRAFEKGYETKIISVDGRKIERVLGDVCIKIG